MHFVRDLTPQRTSAAFFAAIVIGIAGILVPWRLAWMPTLVSTAAVAAYGTLLWFAQHRYFVAHSHEVKNSPYIVGFVMTLASLFVLFWRSGKGLVDGTADPDLVLGQIGAAIFTTVVGILWRHTLFTHDTAERQQDEVLRLYATQLRDQAVELDKSQRQLVKLIQEFVEEREKLFNREEQAFQQFVTGLEKGAQLLKQIETEFPARFKSALEGVDKASAALAAGVDATAKNIELVAPTVDGAAALIGQAGAKLATSLSSGLDQIGDARQVLIGNLSDAASALGDVSSAVEGATSGLAALAGQARTASGELGDLPNKLRLLMSAVEARIASSDEDVQIRLRAILEDLKAMDQIVDQVSDLLQKRLERAM